MAALRFTETEVRRPRTLEVVVGPRSTSRRLPPDIGAAALDEGVRPCLAVVVVVVSLLVGSVVADAGGRRSGDRSPIRSERETVLDLPTAASRGSLHVVQPGETYWSIARALRGDESGDLRAVVTALLAANGAEPLHAGDRVVLPPISQTTSG